MLYAKDETYKKKTREKRKAFERWPVIPFSIWGAIYVGTFELRNILRAETDVIENSGSELS